MDANSNIDPLFQRLALIAGEDVVEKLGRTSVLVFGLGGVGSWCAEALVRSGVGTIGIVDYDTVCESNVNRQVQATSRTLGRNKAEALKERLLEINPRCEVTAWVQVFSRESAGGFGIEQANYVIDAIDTLPHKLDLIEAACAAGVTLFSSMGMAHKLDPTRIKTGDIWDTRGCPLARLVRSGLRKRGFSGSFTAVYSDEPPMCHSGRLPRSKELAADTGAAQAPGLSHKTIIGSAVTVTAAAGMALASLVIRSVMDTQ